MSKAASNSANYSTGYVDLATFDDLDASLYSSPEGEDVFTPFWIEFQPEAWSTHIDVPMKAEGQIDNPTYKVSKSVDFLLSNWARARLPAIKVKDEHAAEYRVAWTENLSHNLMPTCTFYFNSLKLAQTDTVVMDMYNPLVTPQPKKYQEMIGNKEALIKFGSYLPPSSIAMRPMFFFESNLYRSWPICCLGLNEMTFEATFREDLDTLLRVQKYDADNDVWKDMLKSEVAVKDICSAIGQKGWSLKMPTMWGKYALVTTDERLSHQADTKKVIIENFHKFSKKIGHVGQDVKTASHDLKLNLPIRCFFFGTLNTTALKYGNYSNYSTNPVDRKLGDNPIDNYSLTYESTGRYERVESEHASEDTVYAHARNAYTDKGLHFLPYCRELLSKTGHNNNGSTDYVKISATLSIEMSQTSEDESLPTPMTSEFVSQVRAQSLNVVIVSNDGLKFPHL